MVYLKTLTAQSWRSTPEKHLRIYISIFKTKMEMKLIFTLLIVVTFGRYHQIHNFREHHRDVPAVIEKSDKQPVEQYGSSIDKAAFRKYYLQKLAYSSFQSIDSRARFNRWFGRFIKYRPVLKQ